MEVGLSPSCYGEVVGAGEEPYSPSWEEEGSQDGDLPLVIDEGAGEDREDLDDRLLRMLHQDSLPCFLVDFAELSRREEARKDGGRTAGRGRSSGRKTSRQKVSGKRKNSEDFLKTVRLQLASVMREEVRRGLLDMLVEDVTDMVLVQQGHKVVDKVGHMGADKAGHMVVVDEDCHEVVGKEDHKVAVDEEGNRVVYKDGHMVVDEVGYKVVDEEDHKVVIDDEGSRVVDEEGHKVVVWPVDRDVPGEDLFAPFQGCGQILDVKNTLKGFAIIAFSCQESCGVAVKEVQGGRVAGRQVSVKEMVRRLGGVEEH